MDAFNQTLKVFWEVWKSSPTFQNVVMKDMYNSLNKKRPDMLSEIIVTDYEHRGKAPRISDIKNLSHLLCDDVKNQAMLDVVF